MNTCGPVPQSNCHVAGCHAEVSPSGPTPSCSSRNPLGSFPDDAGAVLEAGLGTNVGVGVRVDDALGSVVGEVEGVATIGVREGGVRVVPVRPGAQTAT